MKKDVIYIDVEDDITSIIEKMKKSKAKIVALVPPKRSAVLNSAVNVKLLMKAAKEESKRVVLITTDKALLSLAGGMGLHVAKNLQSKPYLPEAPETPIESDNVIEGDLADLDPDTPVGDLAGVAAATGAVAAGVAAGAAVKSKGKTDKTDDKKSSKKEKKPKKDKGFKIPNFERFRWKLFAGAAALAIFITGWFWAFKIAPKAEIIIQTQTAQLDTVIDFTTDTAIESSDIETNELKGEVKELRKTITEEFTATGEKNTGEKATGTITVTNHCYNPTTIGTGTVFTSGSGLVFVATEDVSVPEASFVNGTCQETTSAPVPVRAESSGDNYNLAPTAYTVENIPSSGATYLVGYGAQMSGGTSVIKTVVSQSDFDKAKASFEDRDYSEEKLEISKLFGDGLIGLEDTFEYKIGKASSTPAVGEEAEKAIMSVEVVFTEVGIQETDVEALLLAFQEPKIDSATQSIYDNGLESANYELLKNLSADKASFKLRTIGIVGPNLDTAALAEQITGMRYSEAKSTIDDLPGVISSEIELSPFWVNKIPKPSKTTITVNISELGETSDTQPAEEATDDTTDSETEEQ